MKDDERPETPYTGDERATLTGFLDFQRATLEWKCDGLSDEQLRQRVLPTSAMSLLGLVRHLTQVEQHWFHISLDDQTPVLHYWLRGPDLSDTDWEVETADVAESFRIWREEVDRSRRIVAESESLDRSFDDPHRRAVVHVGPSRSISAENSVRNRRSERRSHGILCRGCESRTADRER